MSERVMAARRVVVGGPRNMLGLFGATLVLLAGCGGANRASQDIGDSIQSAFLQTLGDATSGGGHFASAFTVYSCDEEADGTPLDHLTRGLLRSENGGATFACFVTQTVSYAPTPAETGSSPWLYYLHVRPGAHWDAELDALPLSYAAGMPACTGGMCTTGGSAQELPPDKVAGNGSAGRIVQSGGTSSTTTPTAPTATATHGGASTASTVASSSPNQQSCRALSVQAGSISCQRALAVANAAIATAREPTTTVIDPAVHVQGYSCTATPYEIDCSMGGTRFSTNYGYVGQQSSPAGTSARYQRCIQAANGSSAKQQKCGSILPGG
jgi:hypothetical protein